MGEGISGECPFLRCQFYYYLGLVRPPDREMMAIEKSACYSPFQEDGGVQCHPGPCWGAPGVTGRQREQGRNKDKSLYVFPLEAG